MFCKWEYAVLGIVEVMREGRSRWWTSMVDYVFMEERKGKLEPGCEYAVVDPGFGRSVFKGYLGLSIPIFTFDYNFVEFHYASAAFEIPDVFVGRTCYRMNDGMCEWAQFRGDVQPARTTANDEDNVAHILWASVIGRVCCPSSLKPPI